MDKDFLKAFFDTMEEMEKSAGFTDEVNTTSAESTNPVGSSDQFTYDTDDSDGDWKDDSDIDSQDFADDSLNLESLFNESQVPMSSEGATSQNTASDSRYPLDSDIYSTMSPSGIHQNPEGYSDADFTKAFNDSLEIMMGKIESEEEFSNSQAMQNERAKARQKVSNSHSAFEDLDYDVTCQGDFCGNKFTYTRYEKQVSFGEMFERGLSEEDTAVNFTKLVAKVTSDVEQLFGGFDRITDLAVVSNKIIINGVSYEPLLPSNYVESLPFDLRNNVIDGEFAWIFDFGVLCKMKNLVRLKFDSADFVYAKVRKDMRIRVDFSPVTFFRVCKSLQVLQICDDVVTGSNFREYSDYFKRQSRAEEMYDKCMSLGMGATGYCWDSVKNVYRDPDRSFLGKAWGILWRGTGTVAVGGVTLAGKTGGLLAKAGKSLAGFINIVKENR